MSADSNNTGGSRLERSFLAEEELGLRRSMLLRSIALPIIAVWIAIENDYPELIFFETAMVFFTLFGVAAYWLNRTGRYRWWHRFLFPALDVLLLAIVNFVPNPLSDHQFAPQILLRFGNELYVFLIIASTAFIYSPRVVVWTGFFAAVVWAAVTFWVYALPDSATWLTEEEIDHMDVRQLEVALFHPRRVDVGKVGRQALLFLLTSGAIAVFVHRSRQLVGQHADAERQRSNLSRYFSANMVDQLAQSDEVLRTSRQQNVAVVFVDIVDFTRTSEAMSPEHLISFLRDFHQRMQQTVFDHAGTLDKYLGDGLMATFGTPTKGDHDATNALRCVADIADTAARWNQQRSERDEPPVTVSVGAHYGAAVLGDIGGDQRLEFAVLGDTVNTASRIESLTRTLATTVLVSGELIDRARSEGAPPELLALFRFAGEREIRGRSATTALWQLKPIDA